MIVIPLQSGSNGNCVYVEAGNVRLLFDAGISGAEAQRRLAARGRDIRTVRALIVSHDHGDHVRGAGVYHRRFGLPLYATRKTLAAAADIGPVQETRFFQAGGTLRFGHVRVRTIPTPHDGADGVAFVIEAGDKRLGLLTDLGHVFDGLAEIVVSLDAAIIESNYDPEMLRNGPYPPFLQERIAGPGGHISNKESACLLDRCADGRMKWVCLAHLSETNNEPALALATHKRIQRGRLPLCVASRYEASPVMAL